MTQGTELEMRTDVPLADLTTLGVGGRAAHLAEARSEADVRAALDWARERDLPVWILGGGSNVIVSDAGLPGLVIQMSLRAVEAEERGGQIEVTAAAGEPWDDFVAHCVHSGWAGIECLSAIPGRVGATPIQNVGAYGQEVSETIRRVRVLDRARNEVLEIDGTACGFSYRDSRFKSLEPGRFVVLAVTFALTPGVVPEPSYAELARTLAAAGGPASLRAIREAVIDIRSRKSMAVGCRDENARSCGSFFVNPVVSDEVARDVKAASGEAQMPSYPQPNGGTKLSAAWLIERSGFVKGQRAGNVGLSTKHALSVVAHEGATAGEVLRFSEAIAEAVFDHFGVRLVREPQLWEAA